MLANIHCENICNKSEFRRLSAEELMLLNCGVRKDLRVPWTTRRSNQSILKEISPEYSAFPGGSDGKQSTCNAGDLASIPGLARSPGDGNGNPLQYSCLENPMDRGTWQATVLGVIKSQTY